jgi:hypothetical protein
MARIYREMPLNSIWEGAGNIMALDLLRALRKADAGARAGKRTCPRKGAHPALDRLVAALPARVEQMASEARRAGWRRTWRWPCRPRCCADRAAAVFAPSAPRAWRRLGPGLRHAVRAHRFRRHPAARAATD